MTSEIMSQMVSHPAGPLHSRRDAGLQGPDGPADSSVGSRHLADVQARDDLGEKFSGVHLHRGPRALRWHAQPRNRKVAASRTTPAPRSCPRISGIERPHLSVWAF